MELPQGGEEEEEMKAQGGNEEAQSCYSYSSPQPKDPASLTAKRGST